MRSRLRGVTTGSDDGGLIKFPILIKIHMITLGTRVKRSRKSKAELDKCDTGKCIKLNNKLVKRIGLKVFSLSALLMSFNFYIYLYRIFLILLYHFVRALRVCPAWWRVYVGNVPLIIKVFQYCNDYQNNGPHIVVVYHPWFFLLPW